MNTARCAASVPLAGNEAAHSLALSPHAWSALARLRPDVFVDGWLREASITHITEAGLDHFVVKAIYVRVNGAFEQRTWVLTREEAAAVSPCSSANSP